MTLAKILLIRLQQNWQKCFPEEMTARGISGLDLFQPCSSFEQVVAVACTGKLLHTEADTEASAAVKQAFIVSQELT